MAKSLLGLTLDEARRSHFFQWFHLDPVGNLPDTLPSTAFFRPESAQFRDLVRLDVMIPATARIREVVLGLRRSFIDAPHHNPFARDIAKSLLEATVPAGDKPLIAGLHAELSQFGASGMPVIMHRDAARALEPPASASSAYQVFLGDGAHALLEGTWCRVRFMNRLLDGSPTCEITVSAGGSRAG